MGRKLLDPIPPGEMLYEQFMKPFGVSIAAHARERRSREEVHLASFQGEGCVVRPLLNRLAILDQPIERLRVVEQ